MKTIQTLVVGLAISISAVVCQAQDDAEFTEPGWFQPVERTGVEAPVQEWSEAGENGTNGVNEQQRLVSAPEIAEAITPEIQALARGLENDPKKIFDYVHDHIRYVHYFGSKKGAQLTLLEQSGNDFDQCALLVALLRAAGQTAYYRFGTVYMPYEWSGDADFKHWLCLTKPNTNWSETLSFVSAVNDYRGFPFTGSFLNSSNNVAFHRVWVRLTSGTNTYSLDPAFKISVPGSGITNLLAAIGVNASQLLTAAGETSNADYVLNLSEVNLRNKLRDYTTNFLGYMQANYPNASVEQIIGAQYILSSVNQPLDQALPFAPYLWNASSPAQDWNYIPTNFMSALNINVDGTNRFLLMPQLQGQKLALSFSTSGLGELWLDDTLLLQKQTSGGSTVNVVLGVNHPHGLWDFANNALINTNWNDHVVTNTYQRTNASYAILYAFEPDKEWLRNRQDRLDRYRQQGLADTSREVTTETLNVMGLNWMLQTARLYSLLSAQQDILLQYHHRLGRMGQEAGQGYYIDVYQQLSGILPASGISTNDLARKDRVFDLGSYFASAAEHALLEQSQASGLMAASTVKMLQIGNTNGQRTYLAKSANWSTVQGNLSNYNLNFLKTNYIVNGG